MIKIMALSTLAGSAHSVLRLKEDKSLRRDMPDGIGIITVEGVLFREVYEHIEKLIVDMVRQDEVKVIGLVLDSPGGEVLGINSVSDIIHEATKTKPVIAYVKGMAASGGYWLASQATKIYASKDALIGSIGVRSMLIDDSEFWEENKVKFIHIETGKHKATGAVGRPISDEEIEHLRQNTEVYFNQFKSSIVRGRKDKGLTLAKLKPLADGRIWVSPEAHELGLIDGVMDLSGAMARHTIVRRAKMSGLKSSIAAARLPTR